MRGRGTCPFGYPDGSHHVLRTGTWRGEARAHRHTDDKVQQHAHRSDALWANTEPVGMVLNFIVSVAVGSCFPAPSASTQDMVRAIRVPKGAGAAASH